MQNRKLIFENGRVFEGEGFGAKCDAVCEVVLNTAVVGYQEILSDPSCYGQLVVMTYPLIGNYGLTDEDYESRTPKIGGFVVREYNDAPSNYRYTRTLADVMAENNIPGIAGVDTRAITRMIRDEGGMRAILTDLPVEEAMAKLRASEVRKDQVACVGSKSVWYSRTANYKYNVVAVDCGMKQSIVRRLNEKGCNVIAVPYNTSAETVMSFKPDALLISNGPGNPEDVPEVIELVRALQGKMPIFGIGLGHQIIALANGATVSRLKFGQGGSGPVKELATGKVELASKHQSYTVDADSVAGTKLTITHVNLLDNSVAGLACAEEKVFSVQYQPESAPGPQDSDYLFDRFIAMMEEGRRNA